MQKVSIVDYGLGNIRALYHIYQTNMPVEFVRTAEQLAGARKLILPVLAPLTGL